MIINNKLVYLEDYETSIEDYETSIEDDALIDYEIEEDIIDNETNENNYVVKDVPSNSSFKSYMSYSAITNKSSEQYKLQQQAETGDYGIRMIDDRYLIALGTYYTSEIGTEVDIVMENNSILKCILGDIKADIHTDKDNIKTKDGSVVEFIVDTESLHKDAKFHGDLSYCNEDFSGEIAEIKIYEN